jgi:hypothetical protein
MVRITHEGVGFGLLSQKLPLSQIQPALVEEEAMKFLRRLFGQEQLRRPLTATENRRRLSSVPSGWRNDAELVQL